MGWSGCCGKAGFIIGGCCPKGCLAEDGAIPNEYPLIELESPESYYRTKGNVIDSDGTLIINKGMLTEGTTLAFEFTVKYGKPRLVVQLDEGQPIDPVQVVHGYRGSTFES